MQGSETSAYQGGFGKKEGMALRSSTPRRRDAIDRGPLLDIPPRTKAFIIVIAVMGIACIVMGSLAQGRHGNIALDKLIHGTGYALLGMLLVLGLRPAYYAPGLLAAALMGLALEYVQKTIGRTFDWNDAAANAIGVAVGAGLGLLGRAVFAYLHTELFHAAERKKLVDLADGEMVFAEGEPSDRLYVVMSGNIHLTRNRHGRDELLAEAGPGDVIGEMGVIQKLPRFATATASGPTQLYMMKEEELFLGSEGREHHSAPVLRILAQRLRKADLKIDEFREGAGESSGGESPG